MEPWIVLIIVVSLGVLFYIAQHFGWIDLSNKSRTSGSSGISGIGDEVFHPTRHEAQVELDRQTILPAPAPLPGDDDFGIADIGGRDARRDTKSYDGQVRIDLSGRSGRGRHAASLEEN